MKKIIVMGIMEFLELDDSTLGPIQGPEKRENVLVLLGAATSLIISGGLCYVLAVAINPYSYLLGLPLLTLGGLALVVGSAPWVLLLGMVLVYIMYIMALVPLVLWHRLWLSITRKRGYSGKN